ncbi:hypothetical protein LXL04_008912 [Taraxacum kok-saghyz]
MKSQMVLAPHQELMSSKSLQLGKTNLVMRNRRKNTGENWGPQTSTSLGVGWVVGGVLAEVDCFLSLFGAAYGVVCDVLIQKKNCQVPNSPTRQLLPKNTPDTALEKTPRTAAQSRNGKTSVKSCNTETAHGNLEVTKMPLDLKMQDPLTVDVESPDLRQTDGGGRVQALAIEQLAKSISMTSDNGRKTRSSRGRYGVSTASSELREGKYGEGNLKIAPSD